MWVFSKKRFCRGLLFLALFSSASLCLFSDEPPLTREEIETWDEDKKTEAILILDNFLIESEQSIVMREIASRERETSLLRRERDLDERESILILQENEYEILNRSIDNAYTDGVILGGTISGIAFAFLGGLVMYNVK